MMDKEYFIVIDGEKIPVSEEVYHAFKRPAWAERKRRQVRADYERSLEQLAADGFEVSDESTLVDEIVEDKLMLDMLFSALDELTADERGLIDALFFDEKSEREVAALKNIAQQTVHKKKNRILKKLKKLINL